MRRTGIALIALVSSILVPVTGLADPPRKPAKAPPGLAKKQNLPPGLAKRPTLPPGLAKRIGPDRPERVWIAFDPRHDDRAWFFLDGEWKLEEDLGAKLRVEVRDALKLEPGPPPPEPLPKVGVELHVVLFD